MHPDSNNSFETRLDRALKQLPPQPAPRTLLPRVLAEIERRAALPWFRRAWQSWPTNLQAVSLVSMLVLLGGLTFAAWQVAHSAAATGFGEKAGSLFGVLSAIGTATVTVLKAGLTSFGQLNPWLITVLVTAVLATVASCLGMGTLCYRLASARR